MLRYLLHVDSLLSMGVLALVLASLEWVGGLPAGPTELALVSSRLLWGGYFYLVARKAAAGKLRLPLPSYYRDTWDTLVRPLVQATAATGLYWIGLGLFIELRVGLVGFLARYHGRAVPFLLEQGMAGYAAYGVGMLFIPTALAGTMLGDRVLPLLDPTHGFRVLRPVAREYALTFALVVALGVVGHLLDALGLRIVAALPIPLAAPVIRYLMRLWVPLAQARLLGEFVHDAARPALVTA